MAPLDAAFLTAGAGLVAFAFFTAFFATLFGALFGAFRALFARLLEGRFFREEDVEDGLAERRAAFRGELRFGRLALLVLPVGRFVAFLAMTV